MYTYKISERVLYIFYNNAMNYEQNIVAVLAELVSSKNENGVRKEFYYHSI